MRLTVAGAIALGVGVLNSALDGVQLLRWWEEYDFAMFKIRQLSAAALGGSE